MHLDKHVSIIPTPAWVMWGAVAVPQFCDHSLALALFKLTKRYQVKGIGEKYRALNVCKGWPAWGRKRRVRGMIITESDRRRINKKNLCGNKTTGRNYVEQSWGKGDFETMLKKAKSLMVENSSNTQQLLLW